jgi:hypothetical protein
VDSRSPLWIHKYFCLAITKSSSFTLSLPRFTLFMFHFFFKLHFVYDVLNNCDVYVYVYDVYVFFFFSFLFLW